MLFVPIKRTMFVKKINFNKLEDQEKYRSFLKNCGLKPKQIAERLGIVDRTVTKYINGGNIHKSVRKHIDLEFSEYDIEKCSLKSSIKELDSENYSRIVNENQPGYNLPLDKVLAQKDQRIQELEQELSKAKSDNRQLIATINNLSALLNSGPSKNDKTA